MEDSTDTCSAGRAGYGGSLEGMVGFILLDAQTKHLNVILSTVAILI
jgi:hypothetical protein